MAEARRIVAQLLAEGGLVFAVFLVPLGKRGVTISSGISLSASYIGHIRSSQDCERRMKGAVDNVRSNLSVPNSAQSGAGRSVT